MIAICLLLAALAGLCFYLGSPHQRLWPASRIRARTLRISGWAGLALSLAAGTPQAGVWAGLFSALTALMAALVALPYLNAACRLRAEIQR